MQKIRIYSRSGGLVCMVEVIPGRFDEALLENLYPEGRYLWLR